MLRVTWEWLGGDAALDVANTIAVSNGVEYDLIEAYADYERWGSVAARSPALGRDEAAALLVARPRILALRDPIRAALFATSAGDRLPNGAVDGLNRVSGAAPAWFELSRDGDVRTRVSGTAVDRLLAIYARSAMEIAADGAARLRICPSPSCGMLYRPTRTDQRWCSTQCGTRARVARHYGRQR